MSFLRRRNRQNTAPASHLLKTTAIPLVEQQRSYVPNVPYLLPKDTLEDQRLNYQHHVLYRTISNHYLSPIRPATTTSILDVGTGTGIWPMEMNTLFPLANIIGVDVVLSSLPYPLPPTCIFSEANILQGLPFPNEQFTFTHQRLLVAAIPTANWPKVIQELVRVTRLGGWIELLEIGDTIKNAGPATTYLLKWMTDISRGLGFDMDILSRLGSLLKDAGCQDVKSQDIPVPLGEWAGTTGQMMKTDVLHGYYALKDLYCPRSQTTPEVFDTMIQAAADEWEQNHASYMFHAAYGRRPLI